ncbi:MAG: hypothetical protein R2713_07230 [Ilumatobacteraceae bacterium]|nr:hypothetical protein [Acidimicrobiales bacterium]MCB9393564.1 hypothetical protein [Acidimicrobiaceae bacterium]
MGDATSTDTTTVIGPVRLSVPPEPSMSRVARLASSGMASLVGCTVDEIEDLKIAVSEVLIALIEHGDGGRVDLEFEFVGRGASADGALDDRPAFVVRGSSPVEHLDLSHPDLLLCRTVLDGVCAAHAIELVDGAACIVASVACSATD